jgi:hypothetical protein
VFVDLGGGMFSRIFSPSQTEEVKKVIEFIDLVVNVINDKKDNISKHLVEYIKMNLLKIMYRLKKNSGFTKEIPGLQVKTEDNDFVKIALKLIHDYKIYRKVKYHKLFIHNEEYKKYVDCLSISLSVCSILAENYSNKKNNENIEKLAIDVDNLMFKADNVTDISKLMNGCDGIYKDMNEKYTEIKKFEEATKEDMVYSPTEEANAAANAAKRDANAAANAAATAAPEVAAAHEVASASSQPPAGSGGYRRAKRRSHTKRRTHAKRRTRTRRRRSRRSRQKI